MNRVRDSWALLDTTAEVGQMGTSGSLPQRFSNGAKANKDNPICHCWAEAPRGLDTGLGGWVSFPWEQRRESGRGTSCVPGPFLPVILGPVTMGDNIPGKLGDFLEEFGRVCTLAIQDYLTYGLGCLQPSICSSDRRRGELKPIKKVRYLHFSLQSPI